MLCTICTQVSLFINGYLNLNSISIYLQVVLHDTPGILRTNEGQRMYQGQGDRVKNAWRTAATADALVLVVDAAALTVVASDDVFNLAEDLRTGACVSCTCAAAIFT